MGLATILWALLMLALPMMGGIFLIRMGLDDTSTARGVMKIICGAVLIIGGIMICAGILKGEIKTPLPWQ